MTACDMAGFMRENANQLVGRLRFHDGADIDENLLAVCDERVKRPIPDNDDLRCARAYARRFENRRRVVAQQLLGLGVAND